MNGLCARFSGDLPVTCTGTLAADKTCNDKDQCTASDTCRDLDSDYGRFIACRGDFALTVGKSCDDYGDRCALNSVCVAGDIGDYAFYQDM